MEQRGDRLPSTRHPPLKAAAAGLEGEHAGAGGLRGGSGGGPPPGLGLLRPRGLRQHRRPPPGYSLTPTRPLLKAEGNPVSGGCSRHPTPYPSGGWWWWGGGERPPPRWNLFPNLSQVSGPHPAERKGSVAPNAPRHTSQQRQL